MRLMNQGFTFLVGNDANAIMFDASDKDLTQREVYNFTVPGSFSLSFLFSSFSYVHIHTL